MIPDTLSLTKMLWRPTAPPDPAWIFYQTRADCDDANLYFSSRLNRFPDEWRLGRFVHDHYKGEADWTRDEKKFVVAVGERARVYDQVFYASLAVLDGAGVAEKIARAYSHDAAFAATWTLRDACPQREAWDAVLAGFGCAGVFRRENRMVPFVYDSPIAKGRKG